MGYCWLHDARMEEGWLQGGWSHQLLVHQLQGWRVREAFWVWKVLQGSLFRHWVTDCLVVLRLSRAVCALRLLGVQYPDLLAL